MKAIARAFGVSRSNLLATRGPRRERKLDSAVDSALLGSLTAIASGRSTYGYRRATAVLNRERLLEGKPPG